MWGWSPREAAGSAGMTESRMGGQRSLDCDLPSARQLHTEEAEDGENLSSYFCPVAYTCDARDSTPSLPSGRQARKIYPVPVSLGHPLRGPGEEPAVDVSCKEP